MNKTRWSRTLAIVGLVAMAAGALDPLEGSVVVLAGGAVAAAGAVLGRSRHRKALLWALALLAVGVGALWGMSAIGGIGGRTGRSMWWALVLLPYPVGWILGLIAAIRRLREIYRNPAGAEAL